jgi:hypothetical protein
MFFAFVVSATSACAAGPEYLAADRSYWVRPAPEGDDANDCLSEAAACATWQAAYDKAALLDFNGFTVFIRAGGSGLRSWTTDAKDVVHIARPWRGWGTLRFVGDVDNPANVRLTAEAGNTVFRVGGGPMPGLPLPGGIFIEGFEVRAPGPNGWGLRHAARGTISVGHMIWGDAGNAQFGPEWFGANIVNHGPYAIAGSSQQHIVADCGAVNVRFPIAVLGQVRFNQTIYAQHGGYMLFNGKAAWDLSRGSITGGRFYAHENATIQGNSGSKTDVNWIPGTEPGATGTGGVYIGD